MPGREFMCVWLGFRLPADTYFMFHYASLLLTCAHPYSIIFPSARLQITIISGNLDYKPKVAASLSKVKYIHVYSTPPFSVGYLKPKVIFAL